MNAAEIGNILTYRARLSAAAPQVQLSAYTGALMRALRSFPEARRAVIAEFDRIGHTV
jgi:hypothetical protein